MHSAHHAAGRLLGLILLAFLATPTLGGGAAAPLPPHIEEANRKVQAQAEAKRAASAAAEEAEVARLATQLGRARVEFGNQLRSLEALKRDLENNLATARAAGKQRDTENVQAQIANVDAAIQHKTAEIVGYEKRIALEIAKAQAAPRAAEHVRRVETARELAARVATKEQQIEAGQAEFESQLAVLDAAQASRADTGDTAGAEQIAKDRAKVIDAQQAWLENSQATLENFRDDLRREYAQNRGDGIGPTSTVGLRSSLRRQAEIDGRDPESALDLVDYGAVYGDLDPGTGRRSGGTAASAAAVAAGAPRATTHLSIFNEVNSDTLLDFANDYAKEARVTYGSWEGFKSRVLEGYVAGVGEGAVDAFKDLFELVVELGDTLGEQGESYAEHAFGVELDVFGDENLAALQRVLGSADQLLRNEDGAGLEEAGKLMAAAEAIKRVMTRKAEQAAANGEKGLQESLRAAGWGVSSTLVDPFQVSGAALKAPGALRRALTSADQAADAASAARAGRVAAAPANAPRAARPLTGVDACKPPGRSVRSGLLSEAEKLRRRAAAVGSNLVPSHAEVFSDVAKKRNEVILVRPVNQHSTALIADNYATKGMGIKGKSADWGPHRGTIPVDPRYSKLGNPSGPAPSADELKLFENLNQKALGRSYDEPLKGADGKYLKDAQGNYAGWETHAADPNHAIAVEVEVPGPDGTPIKVLGDPATKRPITADYDLFAVGNERGPGAAMSGHAEMGSISGGEIATADAVNSGVKTAGYEGGNVVHHGPANRFENALSPKSDFPITAFTPDGNVHAIGNAEELADFYATWNRLGYGLEAMPGWKLDPNFVPTGRFGPLGQTQSWIDRARTAGVQLARDLSEETGEFVDSVTGAAAHAGRTGALNLTDAAVADCDALTPAPEPTVEGPDAEAAAEPGSTGARPRTGSEAGADASHVALRIGDGGFQTVEPIHFEFGGEARAATGDSFAEVGRFFGQLFGVEVEQVFHVTGNNPFDPRDPLAEQATGAPASFGAPTPSVPLIPAAPGTGTAVSPGGGTSPPPANPFESSTGAFNGNNGCSIGSTTFGTQGATIITLTLPPNGSVLFTIAGANQANSQSSNLVLFGLPGHRCEARGIQPGNFQLFCQNGGGGSCLENFAR